MHLTRTTITADAPENDRAAYVAAWIAPAARRAYEAWRAAAAAELAAAEGCASGLHFDDDGVNRLEGRGLDANGFCAWTAARAELHRLTQAAERKARAVYDEMTEMDTVYREGSWRTPDWDTARAATRARIEAAAPSPAGETIAGVGQVFVAAVAGGVGVAAPAAADRYYGPVDGDVELAAAHRRAKAADAVHPTLYGPRHGR